MEGLEAVEVEINECKNIIDFRIDANTYKKDYIKTDKLIKSIPNATIEELSISVQNFGAYSLCNDINFTDSGIPFLMTQNVRHNYIDWNIEKFVDEDSHRMLWKSHCHNGQVLVTMAGEYLGRAAVYDKTEVCSSNQAIAKISFKKNIDPYIISSFLNSRYGQNQINRLKTITGQPNINMSLIKSLIIPSFSNELIGIIKDVMLRSQYLRDNSFSMYEFAKNVLLEELGLKDWEPTGELISIKSFSDFMGCGRLDAEYYQPKYDDLFAHLKQYETKPLSQIATISKSIEPGSDAYQESGIPFVRVSNLSKYGLTEPDIHLDREIYETAELKPRKDTILLSKDGSVGIAYKLEQDLDAITSGAILHLKITDKEFLPDYLTLVLNSIIVKMQAERDAGGSIIQHWKPSEIEQVIIPKLSGELQAQIAEKIQESFALKAESKRLLDLAQTAIETAVEYGEAHAIKMFMK